MKLSLFGRLGLALFASLALGLGMTACGGGTIGYLWVLGQQYNNIAGFKIDDYTGNLTDIPGAPFASNGVNPIDLVVKPGGRFIFVLNQGTGGSTSTIGTGASIAVYSVGGDGVLTFEQSYEPQGYVPQWMQMDSTGSYLYVLTKYSPSLNSSTSQWSGPNTNGLGAITVFSIDNNTGRLSLVTNASNSPGGVNIPFFYVGRSPFMMKTASGCLLTVNSADNTVTEYTVAGSGQLTIGPSSPYQISDNGNTNLNITSINTGGAYVFMTESNNNVLMQFSVGSGCALQQPQGGGITPNLTNTSNPTWSMADSTGKYVYVLNKSTTSTLQTQPYSSISGFTINATNGELQGITGAPWSIGSGPVCMVEDPTNQYMYTSNYNDGTVSGKLLDPTTGILSLLSRGSTFPAVGQATCEAVSGAVD